MKNKRGYRRNRYGEPIEPNDNLNGILLIFVGIVLVVAIFAIIIKLIINYLG